MRRNGRVRHVGRGFWREAQIVINHLRTILEGRGMSASGRGGVKTSVILMPMGQRTTLAVYLSGLIA